MRHGSVKVNGLWYEKYDDIVVLGLRHIKFKDLVRSHHVTHIRARGKTTKW
jgi:hypothetical protein